LVKGRLESKEVSPKIKEAAQGMLFFNDDSSLRAHPAVSSFVDWRHVPVRALSLNPIRVRANQRA
jgi:hypothetical protein